MSGFTPLTGQQLLNAIIQAYDSEATTPANTGVGSTLGAIFEAAVLLALQLQQQVTYLFDVSRLASSAGPDVDSFVNPFGVYRNGPTASSGAVTFTYGAAVLQPVTILVGTFVSTVSGVLFEVIADPTNADYNSGANGYVIQTGQTSTSTTVQCTQTGIVGNVLANTITQPYSGGGPPVPGNPAITNPAAFTSAQASESDQALKVRFAQYISGGGEGTVNSIVAEVQAIQAGLTYSFGDQVKSTLNGNTWDFQSGQPGYFTIVVDIAGAPGTITTAEIANIQGNPNGGSQSGIMFGYRSAGISYNVVPPVLLPVNIFGNLVIAPGYNGPSVVAAATSAATSFVNNIGLNPYGNPTVCGLFALGAALLAVPGVQDLTGLTLNGNVNDVQAPFGREFTIGTITLNT